MFSDQRKAMEWTREAVLQLIEAYRQRPVLWDPNDEGYKMSGRKNEAWQSLADAFDVEQLEIRKKINSILASHRRERQRLSMRRFNDRRPNTKWFAFDSLGFLDDKYVARNGRIAFSQGIVGDEDALGSNGDEASVGLVDSDVAVEPNETRLRAAGRKPHEKTFLPARGRTSRRKVQRLATAGVAAASNGLPSVQRDECATYGEHVANKLRKLDDHSRAIAQHKINNALFEAEMGAYLDFSIDNVA